jgi:replicative superfamily II helicase
VAVDELHLIGDEQRGYLLELILSKLAFLSNIQVISMSATFPNLQQVATWLKAELYVTDYRPNRIDEYIKEGQKFFKLEKVWKDGTIAPQLKPVEIQNQPKRIKDDRQGIW